MNLVANRLMPSQVKIQRAPQRWKKPCANAECSMHQLSPYIGKIKSSIAGELIERYSRKGELVVDPFAGAGTIPFEAIRRERRTFGADISPYARILSKAKLNPPRTLDTALKATKQALADAAIQPKPDLRTIPKWVTRFFHPETLRDAIQFAEIARRPGNEFLMACFLGILHHQRPGFLSFPSSHLVPYLRNKKYPKNDFPELYEYRALRPRLIAKVTRSYKRFEKTLTSSAVFKQCSVQHLKLPKIFDALITSPPYMNALDYGRDNRLRLWFIDPSLAEPVDNDVTQRRNSFIEAISSLALKVESGLRAEGYCIFVVGEAFRRSFDAQLSKVVISILREHAPSLCLKKVITDKIPDVRRTRRECRGVKNEHFLVFQRK